MRSTAGEGFIILFMIIFISAIFYHHRYYYYYDYHHYYIFIYSFDLLEPVVAVDGEREVPLNALERRRQLVHLFSYGLYSYGL